MFKDLLNQAMIERSMTQSQLSALSGIGKSSISQYLSGKNVPNGKAKQKLANALDVSIEYFNAETAHRNPAPNNSGIMNISIAQAAKLLGKSEQFVRVSLQRGIAPFGFATKGTGSKWTYHISPKKFYEYIGVIR